MARSSNFKGQVVAQGGECRKFALWLKHCSRAFNGDVTRDPFCFQKFGLSSIRQIVKGEEYPYETLHLVHNNATRDNLGYFRFLQASGLGVKRRAIWWNWEIGAKLKIVPCSCLTMWPMDVLTVKDSTPSKPETYNSAWNLELLPLPINRARLW